LHFCKEMKKIPDRPHCWNVFLKDWPLTLSMGDWRRCTWPACYPPSCFGTMKAKTLKRLQFFSGMARWNYFSLLRLLVNSSNGLHPLPPPSIYFEQSDGSWTPQANKPVGMVYSRIAVGRPNSIRRPRQHEFPTYQF
jgi:hypothetical protein